MRLLALDTSSVACSVAIEFDGTMIERHEERPREHTKILLPMIRSALGEAGASLADLDAVVLGNGPGSFIGMRIAASVAQGLAFAAGLQIVPVSSMAAIAGDVFATTDAAEVVVAQDAHMQEVYLGVYRCDVAGLPEERVPERLSGQEALVELQADAAGRRIAAGFGWQRYPKLLAANEDHIDAVADILHPRARYLLGLGAAGVRGARAIDPEDVAPAYLRQKVAEKPAPAT